MPTATPTSKSTTGSSGDDRPDRRRALIPAGRPVGRRGGGARADYVAVQIRLYLGRPRSGERGVRAPRFEELLARGERAAQFAHHGAEHALEQRLEIHLGRQREAEPAVDQQDAGKPVRMPDRGDGGDPTAHRVPGDHRTLDAEVVHRADEVVGVHGHAVRPADLAAEPAAAQVRRDDVHVRQLRRHRRPGERVGGDAVCGHQRRCALRRADRRPTRDRVCGRTGRQRHLHADALAHHQPAPFTGEPVYS